MASKNPHAPWQRLWYRFMRFCCGIASVVFFGIRVRGQQQIPKQGGLMLVSNHQSHLDPVLAGVSCHRQMSSLARDTLFRVPILRPLIRSLDAIPLDREGSGLSGMKETLRRLKHGDIVLVFPEGTRTSDGRVARLKSGFCALVRRTGVPLQPMAIAGAFDSWPKWRLLPRATTIHVEFGRPFMPDEITALSDEQLVAEVWQRIHDCQMRADVHRRRAMRELPPPAGR